MTNIAGVFIISFTPAEILFNNPELCHLRVTLPPGSCPFYPPRGTLRYPIIGIRSGSGIGPVIFYIPGAPTFVPSLLK
ncbi:hypothetical protein CDL12_17862 [Handroanthus impetiginosus]|uniref:Uncharacterized protein n=1 Tax=Handroanthus impetiginosus TaxID=429701 RepID=A0A2G9GWB1_9LAMI|nr:hypothetical protein CDL12_17862 [Handroanthus impetiginosus]